MTTTQSNERKRRQLAEQMRSATERMSFQQEVAELAGRMGLEVEQDRARQEIGEWEAELDDLMTQAIDAGFGPEDFE